MACISAFRRLSLFVVAAFSALALAACLTEERDRGTPGGLSGTWLLESVVLESTVGGTTLRDTLAADTAVRHRVFLVIESGSGRAPAREDVFVIGYDPAEGGADTLQAWDVAGISVEVDSLVYAREGNTLTAVAGAGAGGGVAVRLRLTRYTAAFPPAEWTEPQATEGLFEGNWMALRTITEWWYAGELVRDTVIYETNKIHAWEFLLVRGDTLKQFDFGMFVDEISPHFVTDDRIEDDIWLGLLGDTIRVVRTENELTFTVTGEDVDGSYRAVSEFRLFTGAFPPAVWVNAGPPGDATEPNNSASAAFGLTVDAAEVDAYLTAGDQDWFSFQAVAGNVYSLYTKGSTDTYMTLYGVNGSSILEENDDEEGLNAGIIWMAPTSGRFLFRIEGFDEVESGYYSVGVRLLGVPKVAAAGFEETRAASRAKFWRGKRDTP